MPLKIASGPVSLQREAVGLHLVDRVVGEVLAQTRPVVVGEGLLEVGGVLHEAREIVHGAELAAAPACRKPSRRPLSAAAATSDRERLPSEKGSPMDCDLKLSGGHVIDGSGSAGAARRRRGHAATASPPSAISPASPPPAPSTARGKTVTPGFIDIHSHSDWLVPGADHGAPGRAVRAPGHDDARRRQLRLQPGADHRPQSRRRARREPADRRRRRSTCAGTSMGEFLDGARAAAACR